MANVPVAGKGTIFNRWDSGTSAWVPIANIKSLGGPSATRDTIDVTTLDSPGGYRVFIGSLRDGGELNVEMLFVAESYILMKQDFESDVRQQYQIVFPDESHTTFEFEGLVTGLPVDIPLEDAISCSVTIKISGETELDSVLIVESVETLDNIPAANGTQLADVGLPATVEVTFTDDTTDDLDVLWNAGTPIYDGGTAGTYVFLGTLVLEDTMLNVDNVKATVSVVVAAL